MSPARARHLAINAHEEVNRQLVISGYPRRCNDLTCGVSGVNRPLKNRREIEGRVPVLFRPDRRSG